MTAFTRFLQYVMQRTRLGDELLISDKTDQIRLRFRVDPIHRARGAANFLLPVDMLGRGQTVIMSGRLSAKHVEWFIDAMTQDGDLRAHLVSRARTTGVDAISRR